MNQLKNPAFWAALLSAIGAIGAGLTQTGNPQLIAVGAITLSLYALGEQIKQAFLGGATITANTPVPTPTGPPDPGLVKQVADLVTLGVRAMQGWEITPVEPKVSIPPPPPPAQAPAASMKPALPPVVPQV